MKSNQMFSRENGYKDVDKQAMTFGHATQSARLAICSFPEHGSDEKEAY